jgi:selenoprotein W-related protein
MKPRLTIEYCPKCKWLTRAAWMAQELLTTFENELDGVILRPSEVSGRYDIFLNDIILYSRKEEGGFPEITELKKLVRNQIAPDKNLGHTEK